MAKFLGPTYVPKYQKKYHDLAWYKRNFMSYIDWLKYMDMKDDPDSYFKNKEVINCVIINHRCRGEPPTSDFKNYPKDEKAKVMSSIFRTERSDLWVRRDLIVENFKKILSNLFFVESL